MFSVYVGVCVGVCVHAHKCMWVLSPSGPNITGIIQNTIKKSMLYNMAKLTMTCLLGHLVGLP